MSVKDRDGRTVKGKIYIILKTYLIYLSNLGKIKSFLVVCSIKIRGGGLGLLGSDNSKVTFQATSHMVEIQNNYFYIFLHFGHNHTSRWGGTVSVRDKLHP